MKNFFKSLLVLFLLNLVFLPLKANALKNYDKFC